MNETVHHRGPDGRGIAVFGPVGLGHTRLAVIDLSDQGLQPMARGRHHITFNGELYNYTELRRDLQTKGHRFSTQTDTEVLLAALQHWGIDALNRLQGMFAFAWLNEIENAIYLVRDRFGKKPLVYSKSGSVFAAASEAKQIFAHDEFSPRLNLTKATEFLTFGNLNTTNDTFFEGIDEVGAGCLLRFDLSTFRLEQSRWYNIAERIVRQEDTYDTATERTRELLVNSIRRRHIADVRPLRRCRPTLKNRAMMNARIVVL
jgi:asparagine synthase (glutamine-hydrolysing)